MDKIDKLPEITPEQIVEQRIDKINSLRAKIIMLESEKSDIQWILESSERGLNRRFLKLANLAKSVDLNLDWFSLDLLIQQYIGIIDEKILELNEIYKNLQVTDITYIDL